MCSFYSRLYLGNITGYHIGVLIWYKQFPKTTEPINLNSYDNCINILWKKNDYNMVYTVTPLQLTLPI
jgi:hypothetical protein